jgi:photosystem II stability/assembly factor-like uncharacterized protein
MGRLLRQGRGNSGLRILLLVIVLVLDAALVLLVFRRMDAGNAAPRLVAPVLTPSYAAGVEGGLPNTASPSPGVSASPSAAAADQPWSASPLSAFSADIAVRATPAGTCAQGGAILRLTTDGGRHWVPMNTPVRQILRINWTGSRSGWIVGAATAGNSSCAPILLRTTDAGLNWTRSPIDNSWHRLSDLAGRRMHAPAGDVDSPCGIGVPLVDSSSLSLSAAIGLCADGRIYRSADSGQTWAQRSRITSALAVDFGTETTGFLVTPGGSPCAGLRVRISSDTGQTWRLGGCVHGAVNKGVALSFADAVDGVLITDLRTYRTTDGGRTWTGS